MLQATLQFRQQIVLDPYVSRADTFWQLPPVALPILRSLQEVWASCQPTRRPSGMQ